MTISQGRVIHHSVVRPGMLAKLLVKGVTKHPDDVGYSDPAQDAGRDHAGRLVAHVVRDDRRLVHPARVPPPRRLLPDRRSPHLRDRRLQPRDREAVRRVRDARARPIPTPRRPRSRRTSACRSRSSTRTTSTSRCSGTSAGFPVDRRGRARGAARQPARPERRAARRSSSSARSSRANSAVRPVPANVTVPLEIAHPEMPMVYRQSRSQWGKHDGPEPGRAPGGTPPADLDERLARLAARRGADRRGCAAATETSAHPAAATRILVAGLSASAFLSIVASIGATAPGRRARRPHRVPPRTCAAARPAPRPRTDATRQPKIKTRARRARRRPRRRRQRTVRRARPTTTHGAAHGTAPAARIDRAARGPNTRRPSAAAAGSHADAGDRRARQSRRRRDRRRRRPRRRPTPTTVHVAPTTRRRRPCSRRRRRRRRRRASAADAPDPRGKIRRNNGVRGR